MIIAIILQCPWTTINIITLALSGRAGPRFDILSRVLTSGEPVPVRLAFVTISMLLGDGFKL
jgi:hypothetical protein